MSAGHFSRATELLERGFLHLSRRQGASYESQESAWKTARAVFAACATGDPIGLDMPDLEIVGEYIVPPPDAPTREFQTLHIDFGLPIRSQHPVDAARFTANLGRPLRSLVAFDCR